MAYAEVTRRQQFASPNEKRYEKRKLKRLRRRHEKRDPENAGTKIRHFTRGWCD